ncbi:DHHW family protein, partial [Ruminococcus sp.]
ADVSVRTPATVSSDIFNRFAEKYDGTVYFAAIPSSSGVYGDLLQARGISRSDGQQISAFYDFLSSKIRKIDAYNILKMLNENYIYYRTDTKWTTYGAYCVYKTVIQKLGFLPALYDKYSISHITDNFRGNLYRKVLSAQIPPDIIDIYNYTDGAAVITCEKTTKSRNTIETERFDFDKLDSSDMYSVFLGDPAPLIKIKTSVKNDKKLLVIKDSYANCFIPFLIQHYSEIAVVSPEDMQKELSEYVNVNDYGQTLFLFGIENLGNRANLENIIERN